MSLIQSLEELEAKPKPKPCMVSVFLQSLPEGERVALERVLANQAISIRKVHAALSGTPGIDPPGRDALNAHRNNLCRCRLLGES